MGRISPITISAATSQNNGCLTSSGRPSRCSRATSRTSSPTVVTPDSHIHSGEPIRGPMFLVSFGSFIGVLIGAAS